MTDVRKFYILLCGYEIIRKSACIRGGPPEIVLAVPICAYLMETARGHVLFDTGLNSATLADPHAARAIYVNDKFPAQPIVLPEHELLPQLEALGVGTDDVTEIILSHAHSDHTGALRRFPKARVTIQRIEHEAAFSDEGRRAHAFPNIEGPIDWNIIDGDHELMPGIDIVLTRGHRPGHQSAVITLPSGAVKILVGDVVDLMENFDTETLGSSIDDAAAMASLRRLKDIAREREGELVVLHDPRFVEAARRAPAFYD
jgi:N-acyl homoserine lactone hydrolase